MDKAARFSEPGWNGTFVCELARQVEFLFMACHQRSFDTNPRSMWLRIPKVSVAVIPFAPRSSVPYHIGGVKECFTRIGKCYVQRVMDSELIKEAKGRSRGYIVIPRGLSRLHRASRQLCSQYSSCGELDMSWQ